MAIVNNIGLNLISVNEELSEIQNLIKNVFGSNANLGPTGINGVLIQELTKILELLQTAQAELYNSLYNPEVASGIFLDSIAKFDNISRIPAVNSSATIIVTGLAGTVIPMNSQVANSNNDIFIIQDAITIDLNGNGTGTVKSQAAGIISVAANTINKVITSIPGWDTVNNPTDGIPGNLKETDYDLRNTRKYKLGINSANSITGLMSAFSSMPFIIDFAIIDYNSDPQFKALVPQYTISPGQIYISLAYTPSIGNDAVIGNILYSKMVPGIEYLGNYTISFTDSKYIWDTQEFTYNIATPTALSINIMISASANYPADIVTQIKNNIVAAFYGQTSENKVKMGEIIYANRFVPILINLGIYNIISITIGLEGGSQGSSIQLTLDKIATLDANNINVTMV